MSNLRILLINYEFPPLGGGAGNATQNIARELTALGSDVRVLTTRYQNQNPDSEAEGFRVHRIRTLRRDEDRSSPLEMLLFMFAATSFALRLSRTWRADVSIAFFGIPSGPVALALKWRHKIPFIISLRGGDVPGHVPNQMATLHALTKPIIRRIWSRAHATVANSHGLRQLAERTAQGHGIDVIPNGVDATTFTPPHSPQLNATPVLLYAGRISEEKGLDDLVTALSQIREMNWRMHFIGDGPCLASLREQIIRADLADRVTYAGWVPRDSLVEEYQSADIFVFPSRHEGMPNSLLEAMSCGLPVIATRISGNEELVQHNETGFLVPPNDPDSLAEALTTLLENKDTLTSFGIAAALRVRQQYSWATTAKCYLELAASATQH
jgi:glycosyltransferase involved in cell wall biosynthesis